MKNSMAWLCVKGVKGVNWNYLALDAAYAFPDRKVRRLPATDPLVVDRVEWTKPGYGHQS